MKSLRIFYSWQSDLLNKYNRGLIDSILNQISKEINRSQEICIQSIIDRDTKDVSGAPNIVETIFNKIDSCDIFVADISIINLHEDNTARRVPNPNVLIELGYAAAKLGWDNVILIYNLDYGRIEDIPFDLRQRRPVFYKLSQSSEDSKGEAKQLLKTQLFAAIIQFFETTVDANNAYVKVLYPYLHNTIYKCYNSIESALDSMYNEFGDPFKSTNIYNIDLSSMLEIFDDLEKQFEQKQLLVIKSIEDRIAEIKEKFANDDFSKSEEEDDYDNYIFSDYQFKSFNNLVEEYKQELIKKINDLIRFRELFPLELVKDLYTVLSIYSTREQPITFGGIHHWYDEFGRIRYLSQLKFNREAFLELMLVLKNIRSVFLDTFDLEREAYTKSRSKKYRELRALMEK